MVELRYECCNYYDKMIQCVNPLPRSAVGKGPFPGVLLLPGSGAVDMNETAGHIRIDNKTGSKIYPAAQPLFQIAEYMSDRGFVVLRYDKRGVGSNYTFSDSNAWDNLTFHVRPYSIIQRY